MCANDFKDIFEPLETLADCELRQIPKVVAKSLILLQQKSKLQVSENPLTSDHLKVFGYRVSQLPTGLVLELWKTFLYHLEKNIENSSFKNVEKFSSKECRNMFNLCDQLMSTLLENACVVDQVLFHIIRYR